MSTGAEESGGDGSQLFFVPDDEAVDQLMSMGFSKNAAIRALFYTGNQTVDIAADWLLDNSDKNLDTPLENDLQGTSDSSDEDEADDFLTADTFKMVFVVNAELNMGVGKVAAQVAHAALSLFRNMIDTESKAQMLMAWAHMGETKIVLRGENSTQLEALAHQASSLGLDNYLVHDAGHTQVAPGSKTVLGIFGKIVEVDRVTGTLKLL
ncbi:peptidyl-tRNA hydrolase [Plakobranchus ocellatus]|uniref:peptidyl-tRNA hydrolase n=1 Tax=Plakobranchus ocellatus TaxID=259542 RepID=A0AAV4DQF0_9GAST|nr:peptidyl-tRNA hydrolase [Plakobranchus ocellatus]